MAKKKMVYRRGTDGKARVEENNTDDSSSSGDAATEKETERALEVMVKKEKPKVSDDEPADKNSIQYLAWKRRQKNLGKSMGL